MCSYLLSGQQSEGQEHIYTQNGITWVIAFPSFTVIHVKNNGDYNQIINSSVVTRGLLNFLKLDLNIHLISYRYVQHYNGHFIGYAPVTLTDTPIQGKKKKNIKGKGTLNPSIKSTLLTHLTYISLTFLLLVVWSSRGSHTSLRTCVSCILSVSLFHTHSIGSLTAHGSSGTHGGARVSWLPHHAASMPGAAMCLNSFAIYGTTSPLQQFSSSIYQDKDHINLLGRLIYCYLCLFAYNLNKKSTCFQVLSSETLEWRHVVRGWKTLLVCRKKYSLE